MPVTPFHFGPGLLIKSAAPRHVSFLGFAAANVAVDCEPVARWLLHLHPLHGPVHTLIVAGPLGLVAGGLVSLALGRLFPRTAGAHPILKSEASWKSGAVGGLLGGASHPLIDGLMHRDVHPFWPFVDANPLLGLISLRGIYLGCALAGVLGLALLALRRRQPRIPEETSAY